MHAEVSRSETSPIDGYHVTLLQDPVATHRIAALQERQRRRSSLAFAQPRSAALADVEAATWTNFEEQVESEVAFLRALLGGRPLWSPTICQRLRAHCMKHGATSLLEQRPDKTGHGTSSAFVGDRRIVGEEFASLMGYGVGGKTVSTRQTHAWVYRFSDPGVAAAHMASHPAFGAEVPSGCSAARAGLVAVGPRSSRRGCSGEQPSWRFVVVALSWHGEEIPLGPDLPLLVDERASTECTGACGSQSQRALLEHLRMMANELVPAAGGLTPQEEAELPASINELLAGVSSVWGNAAAAAAGLPNGLPAGMASTAVHVGHATAVTAPTQNAHRLPVYSRMAEADSPMRGSQDDRHVHEQCFSGVGET